jgi:flagellar basal body-associated protein FliL
MAHYQPPKQGKASQLIDVIVLVVLTVGALFVPLWMGMAGAAKSVATPVENPTWESLGQNEAQSAKYEALGYDPASAHDLILAR